MYNSQYYISPIIDNNTIYTPIEFTQRDYPTPTVGQQDNVEYASIT